MTGMIGVSVSRRNRAVFEWAREMARREGRSLSDFLADALRCYRRVRAEGYEPERGEDQEPEAETYMRIEHLLPHGEEITAKFLQERFGLNHEAAKKRLQRLTARGVLKRVGRGRYMVRHSPSSIQPILGQTS